MIQWILLCVSTLPTPHSAAVNHWFISLVWLLWPSIWCINDEPKGIYRESLTSDQKGTFVKICICKAALCVRACSFVCVCVCVCLMAPVWGERFNQNEEWLCLYIFYSKGIQMPLCLVLLSSSLRTQDQEYYEVISGKASGRISIKQKLVQGRPALTVDSEWHHCPIAAKDLKENPLISLTRRWRVTCTRMLLHCDRVRIKYLYNIINACRG